MPRSFSSKLLPTDRALYCCVGSTSLFIVVLVIENVFDSMYPPAQFRWTGVSLCFALFLFMFGLTFWHDFIFRTFVCNDDSHLLSVLYVLPSVVRFWYRHSFRRHLCISRLPPCGTFDFWVF